MKHKTIKKRRISRDCWNLDSAFYNWLRERLPVYLKEGGAFIDLTFYKFNHRDKEYTQEELIKYTIHLLDVIENEDDLMRQFEEEKEVLEIWAMIAPAMWW